MRANKLYAKIGKCVFAAEEIKVLGRFVSRVGVRADPGKVTAIVACETPRSLKDLRKCTARTRSTLVGPPKEKYRLRLEEHHQDAFDSIKATLQVAPVLALSNETKSSAPFVTHLTVHAVEEGR
ncbi:Pol protein [Phytophthora palmivora]|uniref:Pol protein n=1 Tax=Phytophthora palmivora TaxID=4796 RepID=A0A2P4Y8J9_9STRA|nr:Pol protein [Phytophthora palmivora]